MVPLRALLATLLLVAGLVLAGPAPQAVACSCAMVETPEHVDSADVVFRGRVTDVQRHGARTSYTFDVSTVYQGTTAETTLIGSASSGAACGLEWVDEGGEYVVFAHRTPGAEELQSSLCSGTARATQNLVRQVEAVTGPGVAPGSRGDTRTEGTGQVDEPGQSSRASWAMGGIAGGVLVLGLGVVVLRRRVRP